MNVDPIVEEIHKIREQLLAEYNGDLVAFMKAAQKRTEEAARAGRPVYSPARRPVEPQPPAKKAGQPQR